jgi:hypothetical protein
MRRRVISVGSVVLAVLALVVVLLNATLVDRRGPAVTSVSLSAPVDGQPNVALTLTAIAIQFSEPVRTGTVEARFRIEPNVAGAVSWDGSTATFTPSERLPPDTEFRVVIEPGFEDAAGNPSTTGVDGFAFRTVGPPTVVSVEPPGGAAGVPVDAPVTITFDRLMDTSAVENAIRVQPAARVQPAWSGASLTLAFEPPLEFGTTYTVEIGTGASDTDGSRLRLPYSTTFTTVEAGLGIVQTLPADGVAGASVRTPIAVVFDGAIDPESVDGALSITPPVGGDTRVVALPDDRTAPRSDDPPAAVLLFQPSEPLAAHTTYTVVLDSVVRRVGAPDEVTTARTWRFTTGQPTTSGHNHIAYLSSGGGTRHVWLMNPDGSAPRQLTSGLSPVTAFDVTLDGARVAYAVGGEVRTMAIDGSNDSSLTTDGRFEYAPRFSPDGRALLVARREPDGTDAGWWVQPAVPGGPPERQVLATGAPPLGSTALQGDGIEGGEGFPAWSGRAAWDGDGRWVLITAGNGDVMLADVELDDPASAAIDTGLRATAAGAWSPAANRFAIVARGPADSSEGLYVVQTDGTTRRVADAAGSVAVASDGDVAVLLRDGPTTRVAVGDLDGDPAITPLTGGAELADRWPTFSPDGEIVLFGRVRADGETRSAGIWTVHAVGGLPVALTTDGAYPRWLP